MVFLDQFESTSMSSIRRSANLVGDWLAKKGLKEMFLWGLVSSPPSPFVSILLRDCSVVDEDIGIS